MIDGETNTNLWTDIEQNQHTQLISNLINRSKFSFEMSQDNITNVKPIKTSFFWKWLGRTKENLWKLILKKI